MRLIVIGTLVIAALAIALLFEVSNHTEPAAASVAQHATPAEPPSVVAAPHPVPPLEDHRLAMPEAHAAPTLAPMVAATADAKPKHIDTPIEILRWSLMRAIRTSEPAVIDCLDKSKALGVTVNGTAMFAFHVTTKDAKAVITSGSVDKSPFPDDVNTCIQNTLTSGELDQELPEGQNGYRVLRELVVDKGVITGYKLKSFLPL